jgi:FAD-linked sulfhydryl oxidase
MSFKNNPNLSPAPENWGPHLWFYLHCCAANYPDTPSFHERDSMKKFIEYLTISIPCFACRQHYSKYVSDNKPYMDVICSNRDNLFSFFWKLHNKVNERNEKQYYPLDLAKWKYNFK